MDTGCNWTIRQMYETFFLLNILKVFFFNYNYTYWHYHLKIFVIFICYNFIVKTFLINNIKCNFKFKKKHYVHFVDTV